MSETRGSSALFKRAEQLKRWEASETNREPAGPRQRRPTRVKFSSGCVFLAACAAGDKDEVLRLLGQGADIDTANVDGLTALHQACIDDNLDMVEFLVEQGADVNRGDNEGWTPLHATASCGFLYIARYLIDKGADVAAVNNDGELPVDITESQKMEDFLRAEIEKRGIDCDAARNFEEISMLRDAKEWLAQKSSAVNSAHPKTGATALHIAASKGYSEVMRVLLQSGADVDAQDADGWTPLHAAAHWGQKETCQILAENLADMDAKNFVGQTPFDLCDTTMLRFMEGLKLKQNKEDVNKRKAIKRLEPEDRPKEDTQPKIPKKVEVEITETKNNENIEKKNQVNAALSINEVSQKESESSKPPVPPRQIIVETSEDNAPWRKPPVRPVKVELNSPVKNTASFRDSKNESNDNEVTLRRTNSYMTDEDSSKDEKSEAATPITPISPSKTPSPSQSPLPNNQQPLRRSFVPPVRDEESETQRKAHAKRVRETRRSTQGVTLEEIKSAEQYVKMTQPNNTTNETPAGSNETEPSPGTPTVTVTATITTAAPTVVARETAVEEAQAHERRPSWRLKVDGGSKFKLEDASKPPEQSENLPSTPSFVRRTSASTNTPYVSSTATGKISTETADTTVTLPLRKPRSQEEKEQDKENDAKSAQATLATQAAIQRRRRPKRRSTGVVTFDNMDDLDQEKDPAAGGDNASDSSKLNSQESGTDRSSRSRVSSTADIRNENGEIDYKKLYEQQLVENERLKDKLRKSDEELRDTKQTLEKLNLVTSKNSLSELEKRERRAMERKLSEMEEELKQLQKLKAENERLKADNRSLTRVINKLTNSAKK